MAYHTIQQLRDALAIKLEDPSLQKWQNDILVLNLYLNNAAIKCASLTHCLRITDKTLDSVADQAEYDTKDLEGTDTYAVDIVIGVEFNVDDATWTPLGDTTITKLNEDNAGWRDADSGTPSKYYWNGKSKIGLYPTPNVTGTDNIKIDYYAKPAEASEIPDDYTDDLVWHAFFSLQKNRVEMKRIEIEWDSLGRIKEQHRIIHKNQISVDVYKSVD